MSFRKARYEYFNSVLNEDECLVMRHHLDDDIEWNLMQSFKTSSIGSPLYIPEVTNNILKPFLSISKDVIYKIATSENLNWHEDNSNNDEKFERNFMRNSIIPGLKNKYNKISEHFFKA